MERRFKEYADTMSAPSRSGGPEAQGAGAEMTAQAQALGMSAASMAGGAATAVGETLGSLASVSRDHAPPDGTFASAATTVAGGLE